MVSHLAHAHTQFCASYPGRVQGSARRRATASALTASRWAHLPRFSKLSAPTEAFSACRDSAAEESLEEFRIAHGILILLGLRNKWITEENISKALASHMPHFAIQKLVIRTLDSLCTWMTAVTLKYAGETQWDHQPSYYLDLRKCACDADTKHDVLLLTSGGGCWLYELNTANETEEVAQTVYHTLGMLLRADLFRALLAEDAMDMSPEWEARTDAYKSLEKAGLLDDPANGLQYLQKRSFEIVEWYGIDTAERLAEILNETAEMRLSLAWRDSCPIEDPIELAQYLVQRTEEWAEIPDLAQTPWKMFVQRSALAVLDLHQRRPGKPSRKDCSYSDYGHADLEVPLAYSHVISFAEEWVHDWLQGFF